MHYVQDITHALPSQDQKNSASALWDQLEQTAVSSIEDIRASLKATPKPFMRLVSEREDIDAFSDMAAELNKRCKHVVLVGTGGSSLGAKAISALCGGKDSPALHVLENVDPHTTQMVLDTIEPEETVCLLISKSGTTVEVLSNAQVLLGHFHRQIGKEAMRRHFIVITEPKSSPLRDIAEHFQFPVMDHDPEVGGRYSVFSLVGLLAGAIMGLDVHAFRRGAASMLDHMLNTDDIHQNYPAAGALLQTWHMHAGRPIHVFMPYCDRLSTLGYWYRQLVAESLGKDHTGITPLASFGAVDQHSMLQLYNDGPADKQFTFLTLDQTGQGPVIEPVDGMESLPHIMGKTIGDMMMAMHHGTIRSVANHGHPLRVLRLSGMHEEVMGALMMQFSLETVISGKLLDVNPYDQPAVEESKRLAREYLEKAA